MNNMLDILITFIASFWIWVMYLGLGIISFFGWGIKKAQAVHAFVIGFASWGIAQMVKDLFPESLRPFQLNGYPPLTFTVPLDGTFPSGHSAAAFGLAVAVFLYNKKLGFLYLLGALLVSLGRVVSNVHFPIDVVGGAILGSFVALVSERIRFGKLLGVK
jgi:undecaprenyl-diphosphatase